jgi:HAMP domain-containing protein
MFYQVIRDEFAEISTDAENLICNHFPLGFNEDGSKQILACAVERSHADTYLAIMKAAGIELNKVHLAEHSVLHYFDSKPEFSAKPFVLSIVDDDILTSMIFQKGICVFQSRTRLYGDDRATLVQNTLDGLSGIIQFNKSQNFDEFSHCFYLGLSDSDLDLVRMNTAYPEIYFSNLELFKGVKGAEILPPNAHIAYLNTLIPDNETDLLQGIALSEKIKKRNKPKKVWIPVLAGLVAVLVCVIAVLWFMSARVTRDVRELTDYMNSQRVIDEKDELLRLNYEINKATTAFDEAWVLIAEREAMPLLTSELIETIVRTGGVTVTVNSFSFRDNPGTVHVTATAATEFSASEYIDRLRAHHMIEYIDYQGFRSDQAGAFNFWFDVKAYD